MIDDNELLRRFAENFSEDAFAELVRRYLELVYHAAVRQLGGDAHAAEDVTQVVFSLLGQKAGSLRGHENLAGWLHTTTRFAARRVRRTEQRRRAREQEAQLMHELTTETTADAAWQQIRPVIDEALGELNPPDRAAVLCRYFAALPLAEVGAKLGVTEDAARMRVDRALEKLRLVLARRGVTSTAAALGLLLAHQPAIAMPAGLAKTVTAQAVSAAVAASSTFNLLQFMSVSKISITIAGLVLALAVGTAGYEVYASREADAALTDATQLNDAISAKLQAVEQSSRTGERDLARLEQDVESARAAKAAAAKPPAARPAVSGGASAAPAWDAAKEGNAFLARHPEARQAIVDRSTAKLNFRWGALFEALNLSPAQIAQFEALMREGETVNFPGPDGKVLALRPGTGMSHDDVTNHLRELLGEDGYARMQQYAQAVPAREFTVQLASALYSTPDPLSSEQAGQLIQIMAASRPPDGGRNGRFDWDAVMTKAQEVLSAPQLAALGGMRAQDQLQVAMNGARTRSPLPAPTATTPPR